MISYGCWIELTITISFTCKICQIRESVPKVLYDNTVSYRLYHPCNYLWTSEQIQIVRSFLQSIQKELLRCFSISGPRKRGTRPLHQNSRVACLCINENRSLLHEVDDFEQRLIIRLYSCYMWPIKDGTDLVHLIRIHRCFSIPLRNTLFEHGSIQSTLEIIAISTSVLATTSLLCNLLLSFFLFLSAPHTLETSQLLFSSLKASKRSPDLSKRSPPIIQTSYASLFFLPTVIISLPFFPIHHPSSRATQALTRPPFRFHYPLCTTRWNILPIPFTRSSLFSK